MIAYAVTTHCRLSREKCRERPIDGSATLTIETSSTVMKNAAQTTASAFQRIGSGSDTCLPSLSARYFRRSQATETRRREIVFHRTFALSGGSGACR